MNVILQACIIAVSMHIVTTQLEIIHVPVNQDIVEMDTFVAVSIE